MDRMVRIWAHGAAHGVWKLRIRRVVGGREDVISVKVVGEVISVRVDIVVWVFRGILFVVVLQKVWRINPGRVRVE